MTTRRANAEMNPFKMYNKGNFTKTSTARRIIDLVPLPKRRRSKGSALRESAVRTVILAAAFFASTLPLSNARAQVVCGPGTHSVLGQHQVPDYSFCAPDENQGNDDSGADSASPPPEPVWKTRWGAIATGEGVYGTALSLSDEQAARVRAMGECQASGKPCRIRLTFHNQCAALASGNAGSIAFAAATLQRARDLAVQNCSKHTSNCRVFYSGCSLPEQVQ